MGSEAHVCISCRAGRLCAILLCHSHLAVCHTDCAQAPASNCSCPSLQQLCFNGLCGAYAWSFNPAPSQLPQGAPPAGFPQLRACQVWRRCWRARLGGRTALIVMHCAALWCTARCVIVPNPPYPSACPPAAGGCQIQSRHGRAGHRRHKRDRQLPQTVSACCNKSARCNKSGCSRRLPWSHMPLIGLP